MCCNASWRTLGLVKAFTSCKDCGEVCPAKYLSALPAAVPIKLEVYLDPPGLFE